ncbi:MAG: hypothetical protein M1594_00985 [Candidatus Marsarchaeota archaeon]|nr:hypothetical protein [Candidatus Marsarchaeota archaeon]
MNIENKFKNELTEKLRSEGLLEHRAAIEMALHNIGIIAGEGDVPKILDVVKNEINENNIKPLAKAFNKHPEIVEALNDELREKNEVKLNSIEKKLKGTVDDKTIKGMLKVLGIIQKNNEIVLTGKLREYFNKEERLWEG